MVKKLPIFISTLALLGALSPVSSCFAESFDYDEVYNGGYSDGYWEGFWAGYDNGNTNGYNEGYVDGYDFGLTLGFEQGYNEGYTFGYSEHNEERYNIGLSNGYDNGYRIGYTDGRNEGYTNGYNDGCEACSDKDACAATPVEDMNTDASADSDAEVAIEPVVTVAATTDVSAVTFADPIVESQPTGSIALEPVVVSTPTSVDIPDAGTPVEENRSVELPWWAVVVVLIGGFLSAWWLAPVKKSKKCKKS